jgi:hypothetical protein
MRDSLRSNPPRRALSRERTFSVWGASEIWLEFSLAKSSAQAKSTKAVRSFVDIIGSRVYSLFTGEDG